MLSASYSRKGALTHSFDVEGRRFTVLLSGLVASDLVCLLLPAVVVVAINV